MLSRGDLAWLAVAAYALHVMEEQISDWPAAARRSMHLSIEYANYRVITTVYLILGAVAAYLVASLPVLALGFAAFLLINALYFHIWPMVRVGGLVGGIITAVFLFAVLLAGHNAARLLALGRHRLGAGDFPAGAHPLPELFRGWRQSRQPSAGEASPLNVKVCMEGSAAASAALPFTFVWRSR